MASLGQYWKGIPSQSKVQFDTFNGQILSWSYDDTLRLWSASGQPKAVLEGHTDVKEQSPSGWENEKGAIQLSDGHILLWAGRTTLRLWDTDGRPGPILKGHTGRVIGAIQLSNGQILSWAKDDTLRLWSSDGLLKKVLKGQIDVKGATELANGHILLWSWHNTLSRFHTDGESLTVLTGSLTEVPKNMLSEWRAEMLLAKGKPEWIHGTFAAWRDKKPNKDSQTYRPR